MIEKVLLDYLNEKLEVPVFMEEPEEKHERYVILEKTGSDEENYIQFITVAIQSYAKTLYDAACLNEDVKKAMRDSITLPNISRSKLNSDYNYTDTTKKKYRYQAVFNLVYLD